MDAALLGSYVASYDDVDDDTFLGWGLGTCMGLHSATVTRNVTRENALLVTLHHVSSR